ncbi:MAG: T9SS type A sorting domain-containing protein [Candidatus Coatesbacteria bacterium]|nr:T9SS type A sorting domain-containing protein [Candidatus Coatesbacteria bacterium]
MNKVLLILCLFIIVGFCFAKQSPYALFFPNNNIGEYPVAWGDHNINKVIFTITDAGCVGWAKGGDTNPPARTHGFQWNNYSSALYHGSIWISQDQNHVSDTSYGWDTKGYFGPYDFVTVDSLVIGGTERSNQDSKAKFNDDDATNPLGVLIEQYGLAWNATPQEDYVILEYTIKPKTATDTINDIYASFYCDWDMGNVQQSYGDDVNWDAETNMMYQNTTDPSWEGVHVGIALLTQQATAYYAVTNNVDVYQDTNATPPFLGLTDSLKFYMATHNKARPDTVYDVGMAVTYGPFDVSNDSPVIVAFAFVAGASLDDLKQNAKNAKARYEGTGFTKTRTAVPVKFDSFINVTPNPVKKAGTYLFRTNDSGKVKITMYNLKGEKVTTLADKYYSKGTYRGSFTTDRLPAGIYFVKLETSTKTLTKKIAIVQ